MCTYAMVAQPLHQPQHWATLPGGRLSPADWAFGPPVAKMQLVTAAEVSGQPK